VSHKAPRLLAPYRYWPRIPFTQMPMASRNMREESLTALTRVLLLLIQRTGT